MVSCVVVRQQPSSLCGYVHLYFFLVHYLLWDQVTSLYHRVKWPLFDFLLVVGWKSKFARSEGFSIGKR